MNWDAIGAIAGVISIILVLLIEWDILKKRFGFIASIIRFPSKNHQAKPPKVTSKGESISYSYNWSDFWVIPLGGCALFFFLGVISGGIQDFLEGAYIVAIYGAGFAFMFIVTMVDFKASWKEILEELLFTLLFPIFGAILGMLLGFLNGLIIKYLSIWTSLQEFSFTFGRLMSWLIIGLLIGLVISVIGMFAERKSV